MSKGHDTEVRKSIPSYHRQQEAALEQFREILADMGPEVCGGRGEG